MGKSLRSSRVRVRLDTRHDTLVRDLADLGGEEDLIPDFRFETVGVCQRKQVRVCLSTLLCEEHCSCVPSLERLQDGVHAIRQFFTPRHAQVPRHGTSITLGDA